MNYSIATRAVKLTLLVLFVTGHAALAQTDDRAKMIEAAKKEGKLVWYTSTNITESKPLLDDFEKRYPFIKGEIFRANGTIEAQVANRAFAKRTAVQCGDQRVPGGFRSVKSARPDLLWRSIHHEGTKHALSKAEGSTKFKSLRVRNLRVLRGEISESFVTFARFVVK